MATYDGDVLHIALGGKHTFDPPVPLSEFRNDTKCHQDPMQFGGTDQNFEGQSAEAVRAANAAEAAMLDSAAGALGSPVDMTSANTNMPAVPSDDYGPGNRG